MPFPLPHSSLLTLRSLRSTLLKRQYHLPPTSTTSYHTPSRLLTQSPTPLTSSHRTRRSSLLLSKTIHQAPSLRSQKRSISSHPWPTNDAIPSLHRSAGSFVSGWRWRLGRGIGGTGLLGGQRGQKRGMKVRSSVKKLCEGCKVCFFCFPLPCPLAPSLSTPLNAQRQGEFRFLGKAVERCETCLDPCKN